MASNGRLSKDKKLIKPVAIALVCVVICFAAGAATILYHSSTPLGLILAPMLTVLRMSFIMRPTPRSITDHGQLRTNFIRI